MKLHLESGGGPYRHVCGLKNRRAVENDGRFLSLHVSKDKARVILPTHVVLNQLSIPVRNVGLLRYGDEKIELCSDCKAGLEEKTA